ncbi:MAG: hypothetical protein V4498_00345 [candidate division FCPU426 bacterium]
MAKTATSFIIADCSGEFNGLVYYTGARFSLRKEDARAYRQEGALQRSFDGALRIAHKIDVWPGYSLRGVRTITAERLSQINAKDDRASGVMSKISKIFLGR